MWVQWLIASGPTQVVWCPKIQHRLKHFTYKIANQYMDTISCRSFRFLHLNFQHIEVLPRLDSKHLEHYSHAAHGQCPSWSWSTRLTFNNLDAKCKNMQNKEERKRKKSEENIGTTVEQPPNSQRVKLQMPWGPLRHPPTMRYFRGPWWPARL